MNLIKSVIFVVFLNLTNAGLPLSVYEQKKYKRQLEQQPNEGLYSPDDYVISYNSKDLKAKVFSQPYATLVEFYNSYCGFCRRFAPTWKQLAEDMLAWRPVILVTAIDCAKDENNNICREFEVMAYPTIRFFSPFYVDGPQKIGTPLKGHDHDELLKQTLQHLVSTAKSPKVWPNFSVLNDTDKNKLFENCKTAKFAFLINDNDNSSLLTNKIILDFFSSPDIVVRRTQDVDESNGVNVVEAKTMKKTKLPVDEFNRKKIFDKIKEYLTEHGIHVPRPTTKPPTKAPPSTPDSISEVMRQKQDEAIKEKVKENKGGVFQADLEEALKFALFQEVTKFQKIDGERLLALQRFLNVLVRYFPFNDNGQRFLKEVRQFVMNAEAEIEGEKLVEKLKSLEENRKPVFSSNRWIGCYSGKQGLRGFPCGMWTLFHYLTVQAAETDISTDPLEILQAMHGYIKYFFGCSECSQHFQQMATKNKIWNVTSKDDAALWLWSSHNEVNKRLSGDPTEDPEFPKIQYPSREMCPACRKPILTNHHNHQRYNTPDEDSEGIEWDLVNILVLLKSTYGFDNRNYLGINDESILPQKQAYTAEAGGIQTNRIFGNVLNDMDIRMGVLLYVLCIVMMLVAVKLVVRRGYKKKMYTHDILGKV